MGSTGLSFNNVPLGELPPPAPKSFFGRNEFIQKIVGRVEKLESVALIGTGGIGKTSIALTVLHIRKQDVNLFTYPAYFVLFPAI